MVVEKPWIHWFCLVCKQDPMNIQHVFLLAGNCGKGILPQEYTSGEQLKLDLDSWQELKASNQNYLNRFFQVIREFNIRVFKVSWKMFITKNNSISFEKKNWHRPPKKKYIYISTYINTHIHLNIPKPPTETI